MVDSRAIQERLERSRSGLLMAVERVSVDIWGKRPGPNKWSVAEVIGHLTMVETVIQRAMNKAFSVEPQPVGFWQRWYVPAKLTEYRLLKVQTPVPLDSALLGEKKAMMEEYGALRSGTLAILEANAGRDLRRWRWRHPFLGNLNGHEWFKMIASHEVRHTKQIREIVESLS